MICVVLLAVKSKVEDEENRNYMQPAPLFTPFDWKVIVILLLAKIKFGVIQYHHITMSRDVDHNTCLNVVG